jgi:small subunit ribosomal protein S1
MAVDQNNGQVENYEDLLEDYSHFAPPAADEVLQGTVLAITGKDVIIDFGYKSEGLVPLEQFQSPGGQTTVQVGDVVDVMIDHGEQPEGYVLLSHTRAARLRIWDNLDKAYQEQLVISGRVLGRVKGGLAVDVGIKAFMPGSQADPRPVHNLDSLVGQDIPVKIIKLNRRRGNVVVSRKVAVEEEINVRKTVSLEHLTEGSVVTGVVKNLTDYGAFIDLGGIDGLLHVTDMSYGRITHPSEMLHVGDDVTVKVLKFDKTKERVSLGIKQLEPEPWETVIDL